MSHRDRDRRGTSGPALRSANVDWGSEFLDLGHRIGDQLPMGWAAFNCPNARCAILVLANGHVYVTQRQRGMCKNCRKTAKKQQQVVRLPRNADIPGPISPLSNREMHYPKFQGQQMFLGGHRRAGHGLEDFRDRGHDRPMHAGEQHRPVVGGCVPAAHRRAGRQRGLLGDTPVPNKHFRLNVVVKVEPSLRIRTPIQALSDAARAKFDGVRLADERFHRPASISLVLGSDVYANLIQPGFLKIDDGLPVAQNTVFGWTVSGACTE
ncbi:GD18699 [Drosophila simulans]|uniref:GD18699 n=1 Tax=Drosophila simulans TaxID=7240 RepID=B4QV71_DROSI|nr:GD18699 [Drosophila simulans]